jgi:hypothetical protein
MPRQSEQQNNTHLLFDGEKIIISSDIVPVFNFLSEIEKEVNSFLDFQKKLDAIREQHMETLELVSFLIKKLEVNNIKFNEYKLKENPGSIAEKFNFDLPIRSQVIVLFASLEVLYYLDIAYNEEFEDEDKMREFAMNDKNVKKFINSLILNDENKYYKKNKKRLCKMNSKSLRNLRNSLTHFFSLPPGGPSLAPSNVKERVLKLENILKRNKLGNVIFISPDDLYELFKTAHILRLERWNDNFYNDRDGFKRKFKFVINLVEKYGAVSIQDKHLNI